jgi:hypothetical protein
LLISSFLDIFFTVTDFSFENFLLVVLSKVCGATNGYGGLATTTFAIG